MSRFYASIQGARGEATRQGHRAISGHVRGWDLGVRVDGYVESDTDADVFEIRVTGGSNGSASSRTLGWVRRAIDGSIAFERNEGAS